MRELLLSQVIDMVRRSASVRMTVGVVIGTTYTLSVADRNSEIEIEHKNGKRIQITI